MVISFSLKVAAWYYWWENVKVSTTSMAIVAEASQSTSPESFFQRAF